LGGELKIKYITLLAILVFSFTAVDVVAQEEEVINEEELFLEAQETEDAADSEERLTAFTAWDFIRMVLILGAVIGVIYFIFYLLKRSGRTQYQDNQLFRVLSSMPINGSRSLHLIEVGEQYFLVGSAENSVSLISEIQDKETIDGIRLKLSNMSTEEKSSFKDILSNIFKPAGGQGYRSSFTDSLDFMKNQRDRLKRF
jgi:flagellar protein FliO/FliZ